MFIRKCSRCHRIVGLQRVRTLCPNERCIGPLFSSWPESFCDDDFPYVRLDGYDNGNDEINYKLVDMNSRIVLVRGLTEKPKRVPLTIARTLMKGR